MYIVSDSGGHEVDPVIDQQYQELFASRPRSLADQRPVNRHLNEAAETTLSINFDRLKDARSMLAYRTCSLFTGQTSPETSEILYGQSIEIYSTVLSGVMHQAALRARESMGRVEGVSDGEAAKFASARVLGHETLDRVRAVNDAFSTAFNEVGARMPRLKRVARYLSFVVSYPDRPTHILLEGHEESDIPAAEAAYADYSVERYLSAFDESVTIAREASEPPSLTAFIDEALDCVLPADLANEANATEVALKGAL